MSQVMLVSLLNTVGKLSVLADGDHGSKLGIVNRQHENGIMYKLMNEIPFLLVLSVNGISNLPGLKQRFL